MSPATSDDFHGWTQLHALIWDGFQITLRPGVLLETSMLMPLVGVEGLLEQRGLGYCLVRAHNQPCRNAASWMILCSELAQEALGTQAGCPGSCALPLACTIG